MLLHHWPGLSYFKKYCFLTCWRVTGSGFIISANIDDREAIQVHAKQPLTEGLSCYKLSRDSYYIHGYPYRTSSAMHMYNSP